MSSEKETVIMVSSSSESEDGCDRPCECVEEALGGWKTTGVLVSAETDEGTPELPVETSTVVKKHGKEEGPSDADVQPGNKGKGIAMFPSSERVMSGRNDGVGAQVGYVGDADSQFDPVRWLTRSCNFLLENSLRAMRDLEEERKLRRKMKEDIDGMKLMIAELMRNWKKDIEKASASEKKSGDGKKRGRDERGDLM